MHLHRLIQGMNPGLFACEATTLLSWSELLGQMCLDFCFSDSQQCQIVSKSDTITTRLLHSSVSRQIKYYQ